MERLTTRDSEYNFITLKRTGRSLCNAVCEEKTLCSICGRVVPLDAPYCNCGAKMEE